MSAVQLISGVLQNAVNRVLAATIGMDRALNKEFKCNCIFAGIAFHYIFFNVFHNKHHLNFSLPYLATINIQIYFVILT